MQNKPEQSGTLSLETISSDNNKLLSAGARVRRARVGLGISKPARASAACWDREEALQSEGKKAENRPKPAAGIKAAAESKEEQR